MQLLVSIGARLVYLMIIITLSITCTSSLSVNEVEVKQELDTISMVTNSDTNNNTNSLRQDSCHCLTKTLEQAYYFGTDSSLHWSRTIDLPAEGHFVGERHYVTRQDSFPAGRSFPIGMEEGIETHLARSLNYYQAFDSTMTLDSLYSATWEREWTPAEGGAIGQGAIGARQVDLLHPSTELWLMTMMWAAGRRPAIGTKFLLKANGKAVVVVAGYETGPGSSAYLGGVTTEVQHWLQATNETMIQVSYLRDQTLAPGPVDCMD